MSTITATDLARRTNQILDALADGESITIRRNNTVLGTIVPPQRPVSVREALGRIRHVPRDVGTRFQADLRGEAFDASVDDPWLR
jgi:antitoxin (DNA-binding transcriptional repressor) of toxin-antitoxin stability system